MLAQVTHLGDRPHIEHLIGTIKVMLDAYTRRQASTACSWCTTSFVNTMTQKPDVDAAAAGAADRRAPTLQEHWDYIYEPDAADMLDGVLMRYIESLVYQGAVENVASEMAARMVAMKARHRQRRQADRRAAADLQQGAPGRDHQGNWLRSSAARQRFDARSA